MFICTNSQNQRKKYHFSIDNAVKLVYTNVNDTEVSPMNLGKKIKGFTLVELIVVIAIISVLSGIMSLVVTAFVRNARRETADDYAHMMFTGFQNILVQSEIKQDQKLFDADPTKTSALKHSVITFSMMKADVNSSLTVRSEYADSSTVTATWTSGDTDLAYTGATMTKGDMYDAMQSAILSNVDNTFEGGVRIYVDYENYEVKSVIYHAYNSNLPTSTFIGETLYKQYDGWYYGLDSRDDQEKLWEGKKATGAAGTPDRNLSCGVYPYQNVYTT